MLSGEDAEATFAGREERFRSINRSAFGFFTPTKSRTFCQQSRATSMLCHAICNGAGMPASLFIHSQLQVRVITSRIDVERKALARGQLKREKWTQEAER